MTAEIVSLKTRQPLAPVEIEETQSAKAVDKAIERKKTFGLGKLASEVLRQKRLDGLKFLETQNNAALVNREKERLMNTDAMALRFAISRLMDNGMSEEQICWEVEGVFAARKMAKG